MAINSHEFHARNNNPVQTSAETSETASAWQQAQIQETYHYYQLRIWNGTETRIDALIKKLNPSNIRDVTTELLFNNLLRGRGLLCRSIIEVSLVSPTSIPVLASLVSVVNSKLPDIGYLLLKRIVVQFSDAFEAEEERVLSPLAKLLAQLINHGVVCGDVASELLLPLLDEARSDVFVDVAVTFLLECGYRLQRVYPRPLDAAFESLAEIKKSNKEKRLHCLITGLFQIRSHNFVGFMEPKPDLDLVKFDDQITHKISFLDNLDPELSLDRFSFDHEFLENETKYHVLTEDFLTEATQ